MHCDNNHPIENKETGTRHSINREEPLDGKSKVNGICRLAFEEVTTEALSIFYVRLSEKTSTFILGWKEIQQNIYNTKRNFFSSFYLTLGEAVASWSHDFRQALLFLSIKASVISHK